MTKSILSLALLAIACVLSSVPVQAQNNRSFISGTGSDANACTFVSPCRNAQRAHDMTNPGGEINVLDPAGYGSLTITKAIGIQGHGWGELVGTGGAIAVTINADANDRINLSGLIIEGFRTGLAGIVFNSGASLVVENCIVRNMAGDGLEFISSAATLQTLSVSNSYFASNGQGILIWTKSAGAITAAIERSAFFDNFIWGIEAFGANGTGPLNVAVTDSVASNGRPGSGGFLVTSDTGHSISSLVLTRVTASGNTDGIAAVGANAILRLTQSTVTGNAAGYNAQDGGTVLSYGDNVIDDNGNNLGSLGSATKR